jgi:membrane protease YdiL (CAAX protease family)
MSARGGPPFPDPSRAFTLAATALFLSLLPLLAGNSVVAAALGSALGLGGVGVLAARLVPEPTAERLGLAPFPARAIAPVLLLAPVVLLVSELDNWIRIAFSAPASEALGKALLPAPEAILLAALLSPVLEEFFFRGVLLQGCVSALGRTRAVLYVAALQIVLVPSLAILDAFASEKPSTAVIVSQGLGTFTLGALYGLVRLATRSLLPGVVLSGVVTGLGIAAGALAERAPIPGFNAPGATTPLVVLLPAAASVALGVRLLLQQLATAPALPPVPPTQTKDDEEPGSLF